MNVFDLQDRCEKLRAPGYLQLTVSMYVPPELAGSIRKQTIN